MKSASYLIASIFLLIGCNADELTFDTITWTKNDWDTLYKNASDLLCQPSYTRSILDPPMFPDKCPAGYPDADDGLLCYEECPAGWTSDGLTMCYEDCKSGWDEILGVCWKNTLTTTIQGSKSRGIGKIPSSCGSGKVKEAGLCYNKCPSGWTGIACQCWKGLKVKNRGCGSAPNQCPSSHPHKQTGLCYKECPAGYPIAEGPICWEDCEAVHGEGAIDMGVTCQHGEIKSYLQDRYFRKSKGKECSKGELSGVNCYEKCQSGYDGVLGTCWNKNLGDSIAAVMATSAQISVVATCYQFVAVFAPFVMDYQTGDPLPEGLDTLDFDPFLKCAWAAIQTMAAIDDSWDTDGVTVAVTGSVSVSAPVVGVNAYGGIAFDFESKDKVTIWSFDGGCKQAAFDTDIGIGIDGGMALLRSVGDIDGVESFMSMGVSVFDLVDVGSSWAFDSHCKVTGMSSNVGVSCSKPPCIDISQPVSPAVAAGECINFHRKLIGTVTSPAARSSSAKIGHSLPEQPRGPVSYEWGEGEEGGEGGDYVFVLKLPTESTAMLVVIGLSVVLSVAMMAVLCLRCYGGTATTRTYSKVGMETDTEMEMEMEDLNAVSV